MIGIEQIASYIPSGRLSNYEKKEKFGINDNFIEKRIGVKSVAVKERSDDTSDLCVKSYRNLLKKIDLDISKIDVAIVVTQNPDYNIPHTSAIVHGKIGLPESCACFDVSLGCSGYVYGLSIMKSLMLTNNFRKGLLFTADPYSKIVDPEDKNTSLLFGDAAAVTLLSGDYAYDIGNCTFGTVGSQYKDLICVDRKLFMNGAQIFNFVTKYIPADIEKLLKINDLALGSIDKFILHQGSRFLIETLSRDIGVPAAKVAFDMSEYGNTVSSSLPIILEEEMQNNANKNILLSGFGAGLSWSGAILRRNN